MNPLQLTIIEKAGNDNGFEHALESNESSVTLASAQHSNHAVVRLENGVYLIHFQTPSQNFLLELQRSFPQLEVGAKGFSLNTEAELAKLLRRAASLSRALPNQAVNDFQQVVSTALAELPASIAGTEVERMVRQRIGQNKFRDAMLDYWGGACAVTGVAIPEALRASHAKPWAECATDAERLDVFNGFLLSANLDALFDRFLISFDSQGALLISTGLKEQDLISLGIYPGMKLRWITESHQYYLALHRSRLKS